MAHPSMYHRQYHEEPTTSNYKPTESIQSSHPSLYNQYRYNHEFEKRLLLEPRYLDESADVVTDEVFPVKSPSTRRYVSNSTINFGTSPHPAIGPLR